MRSMPRSLRAAIVGTALLGCADAAPTPKGLSIAVAPLTLPSIGKVCYDIEVTNGPDKSGDTVWAKGTPGLNDGTPDTDAVCSTQYGNDGGGDITYIGTCDADGQADPSDAAGERTNSVTVWFDGIYDDGLAYIDPTGPNGWRNPCVDAEGDEIGCTLNVLCEENADALVEFNFTVMREANQGFFDIAVNFGDIFCSAKFDCSSEVDGVCSGPGGTCTTGELATGLTTCDTNADCRAQADLNLLHDAEGDRAKTFVLGFACTAGPGTDVQTELYLNDLEFDCGGDGDPEVFSSDFTLSTAGIVDGNQCDAGATGDCGVVTTHGEAIDPNDYFFQFAVYKGEEQLDDSLTDEPANKKYWNLAIGVKPAIANCQIRTMGTAEDANDPNDLVADRLIQPGNVYPVIAWDIDAATCTQEPLSFAPGGRVAALAIAAGTSTMIGYTPPTHTGVSFKNARSATLPPAAQCNPSRPCLSGFRCTSQGTCESVDGKEVLVASGTFWMGCNPTLDDECGGTDNDDEDPQHLVTLRTYAIDKHEVTAAEYRAYVDNGNAERAPTHANWAEPTYPTFDDPAFGQHPVNWVRGLDAQAYCASEGKTLCSEAQWERAARGGCETIDGDCRTGMRKYPWGEQSNSCEMSNGTKDAYWQNGNSSSPWIVELCNASGTVPVGTIGNDRSPYGVMDMAGNVMEWVADYNFGPYSTAPVSDPLVIAANGNFTDCQMIRGGSFLDEYQDGGGYPSDDMRSSNRYCQWDQWRLPELGFRCCRPCGAPPSFALGQPDSAPGAGNPPVWSTGADGRSLTQSKNSAPSIYTTNLAADGHVLEFDLLVTNDNDDDYIGWTVGEELGGLASTGSAGDRDYLLFDWKQGAQAVCFGSLVNGVCPPAINYLRNPGLQLNRVTGPVTNYTLHAPTDPARAGHNVAMVTPATTLGATGWQLGRTYRVRMAYSTTLIQVWVTPEVMVNGRFNTADPTFRNEDRQLEFDLTGNFPDGRFGFYSNSQSNTSFRFVSLDDGAPSETCE